MGKYWDAFKTEFQRVSPNNAVTASLLESMEEHIRASVADQSLDTSPEERERIAVERLGTPRTILAGCENPNRRKWLPVWITAIGLIWCAFWMVLGSKNYSMAMVIPALYIVPLAVFVASFYSRTSKFWALAGVTVGIGIVTIVVMSTTWLNLRLAGGMGYLPKWDVAAGIAATNTEIETQSALIADISNAREAFKLGDREAARRYSYSPTKGWRVPTPYWLGYRTPQFAYIRDFEEARRVWSRRGGQLVATLNEYRNTSIRLRESMSDPRSSNAVATFQDNASSFVQVALGLFVVLAMSHGLALTILEVRGAIDRKRWRNVLRA